MNASTSLMMMLLAVSPSCPRIASCLQGRFFVCKDGKGHGSRLSSKTVMQRDFGKLLSSWYCKTSNNQLSIHCQSIAVVAKINIVNSLPYIGDDEGEAEAQKNIAKYMAMDEATRRKRMHGFASVFEITEAAHPAKRFYEETVKPLANRKDGVERGVLANVRAMWHSLQLLGILCLCVFMFLGMFVEPTLASCTHL